MYIVTISKYCYYDYRRGPAAGDAGGRLRGARRAALRPQRRHGERAQAGPEGVLRARISTSVRTIVVEVLRRFAENDMFPLKVIMIITIIRMIDTLTLTLTLTLTITITITITIHITMITITVIPRPTNTRRRGRGTVLVGSGVSRHRWQWQQCETVAVLIHVAWQLYELRSRK